MPGASEYNQRLDSLVGTCGDAGPCHECNVEASIVVGDGDDANQKILDAHRTQQLAVPASGPVCTTSAKVHTVRTQLR